jgi:hypothetical protein
MLVEVQVSSRKTRRSASEVGWSSNLAPLQGLRTSARSCSLACVRPQRRPAEESPAVMAARRREHGCEERATGWREHESTLFVESNTATRPTVQSARVGERSHGLDRLDLPNSVSVAAMSLGDQEDVCIDNAAVVNAEVGDHAALGASAVVVRPAAVRHCGWQSGTCSAIPGESEGRKPGD